MVECCCYDRREEQGWRECYSPRQRLQTAIVSHCGAGLEEFVQEPKFAQNDDNQQSTCQLSHGLWRLQICLVGFQSPSQLEKMWHPQRKKLLHYACQFVVSLELASPHTTNQFFCNKQKKIKQLLALPQAYSFFHTFPPNFRKDSSSGCSSPVFFLISLPDPFS